MLPTKMLLATNGSGDAASAARMAVGLSERLDSPLHVVYVESLSDFYPVMASKLYYPGRLLSKAREAAAHKA